MTEMGRIYCMYSFCLVDIQNIRTRKKIWRLYGALIYIGLQFHVYYTFALYHAHLNIFRVLLLWLENNGTLGKQTRSECFISSQKMPPKRRRDWTEG